MPLPDKGDRLRQGDILQNVDFPMYSQVEGSDARLRIVRFPRAVVLSQDCDIDNEHEGTLLISILMAPLYEMSDAWSGQHLLGLGIKLDGLPGKKGSRSMQDIKQNANPRYHCLPLSQAMEGSKTSSLTSNTTSRSRAHTSRPFASVR